MKARHMILSESSHGSETDAEEKDEEEDKEESEQSAVAEPGTSGQPPRK